MFFCKDKKLGEKNKQIAKNKYLFLAICKTGYIYKYNTSSPKTYADNSIINHKQKYSIRIPFISSMSKFKFSPGGVSRRDGSWGSCPGPVHGRPQHRDLRLSYRHVRPEV